MRRSLFFRLSLVIVIVVCGGTVSASTPTACAETPHCVYLPLVSTPELVAVSNVDYFGTRSDNYAVAGEVNATTSTPVYSVTLEVRSYDSQEQLIDTTTGSPVFTATLPGQPNPFYFVIGVTEDEDIARYDVRVIKFSRTHPRTVLPVDVVITSYEYDAPFLNLAGTLTNNHAVPLQNIRSILWSDWTPDDLQGQMLATRLAPFETVPFSTTMRVDCINGCDQIPYHLVVQGVVP